MSKQEFSVAKLANMITTEADAYRLLETLRWTDGQPDCCPQCGVVDARFYFLAAQDGTTGRATRTGANSQRRVWKCSACRKQFSVLTGTIFHGSKVPVRTWLFVIFEFCSSKNSLAAREIERKYSVTAKTAWFMLHRIREATKREPLAALMSGVIASDETWIGGNPKNLSKAKRAERPKGWEAPYGRKTDKPSVQALVNVETGEVRSQVIADVSGATLRKTIADQVDMADSTLVTDEWKGYRPVGRDFASHQRVNHSANQYVNKAGFTTNQAERFFGQLKRSLDGTHHHVSVEHLPRYLAQFDWLATYCKDTDSERMRTLLGSVEGRRLTCKPLTGSDTLPAPIADPGF